MDMHDEVQGEALPDETVSHETESGENPETVEKSEEATTPEAGDDATARKPKKGVQERINELVRQREEAAREARLLREQLEAQQKPKPQQPTGRPDVAQFERYEDYLEALTDWKVEQRTRAQQAETIAQTYQREMTEKRIAFQQRAEKFEAEDFAEVAFDPSLPVSDAMRDVILDSDKGPELLYHLGHNRAEAARIAALPPVQAARALGLLEAELSLPRAKTVTAAPPPIKPVAGRGEPVQTDPEKMTADEWREWRLSQLRGA